MIIFPFNFHIVPMEKLFLINFEKDPDELYHGFEPQWFDDPVYGRGLRVIAWRRDGFVDIYQQPDLPEDEDYSVAAKGLGDLFTCPMPGSYFGVSDKGVDTCFAFKDKAGRQIEVKIVEKNPRPTRPFTLLAPVGSSSENPTHFPVYLMYSFNFVRRSMTEVKISINGRLHKPDPFPVPLNGSRIYFMRYSNDTFLVNFCPAYTGPLKPFSAESSAGVDIVTDQAKSAIHSISAERGQHRVSVIFTPPFPCVNGLEKKAAIKGQFMIKSNREEAGRISGVYDAVRDGDEVRVKMHPSGGWDPKPGTLFLRFLFRVVSMFRKWPATYLWTAAIKLRPGEYPLMESGWSRTPD